MDLRIYRIPVKKARGGKAVKNTKIFKRGKPHLEIAVFRTVSALESIGILRV